MSKSLRIVLLVLLVLIVLAVLTGLLFSKIACRKFPGLSSGRKSFMNTSMQFPSLPPNAPLRDGRKCGSLVQRTAWEPRPDNTLANHRVPTAQQIARLSPWGPAIGLDAKADIFRKQITGNFTGTTDEIIQWASCKWGIDVNIMRAQAVKESEWHQSYRGDWTTDRHLCPPGTWNDTGCYQSYGILQIKYIYNISAWPMSRDNTAFNIDYMYGYTRACYEGWTNYLYERSPSRGYSSYHAGDLWGCIGAWYSGGWYDQVAIDYISAVKTYLHNGEWSKPGFSDDSCYAQSLAPILPYQSIST
jgi:hypothetical protein